MATHAIETGGRPGRWSRIGGALLREFRSVLPPTIFFFIGFNLILFTTRLVLADYLIQFAGFLVATVAALVGGKAVLVADKLPFMRHFDHEPLIKPILFKTVIYTLFVFVARLLEAFVQYVAKGGEVGGGAFIEHQLGAFSLNRFIAVQIWILVL